MAEAEVLSDSPGSVAVDDAESSPQALSSASGNSSATSIPRAFMDRVYAPDVVAAQERRGQYGDRERGHDAVRDVVGMRIVGAGEHRREVGEVTVHGVRRRPRSRRPQACAAGTRTSPSEAGVRAAVTGTPATGSVSSPSARPRLTSLACSRGSRRPSRSAFSRRSRAICAAPRDGLAAGTAPASTSPSTDPAMPQASANRRHSSSGAAPGRRADHQVHPLLGDGDRPAAQGRGVVLGVPEVRPVGAGAAGHVGTQLLALEVGEGARVAELDLLLPVGGGLAAEVASRDDDVEVEPVERLQRRGRSRRARPRRGSRG